MIVLLYQGYPRLDEFAGRGQRGESTNRSWDITDSTDKYGRMQMPF